MMIEGDGEAEVTNHRRASSQALIELTDENFEKAIAQV